LRKSVSSNPIIQDIFAQELQLLHGNVAARVLIFTHRQADPDAICAAAGVSLLLQRVLFERKFDTKIIAPQGVSQLGEKVAAVFQQQILERIDNDLVLDCDLIVAVDTGDAHLLEPYLEVIVKSSARKILIDHHVSDLEKETWQGFDRAIVDSGSTSTCEMITLGFSQSNFSKEISRILLTGLMFDSQHLGIATEKTLEAALMLVQAGADISEAKQILRYKHDRSEVLARLKASQRLQFEESDGWVIVKSEVSSFQASVARMLVEIGADVGIAYGENGDETRLSARSTHSFKKDTGIDLAVEVRMAAEHFGIVGGGHSTAASISGKIDAKVLSSYLIQHLKGRLPKK